LALGWVAWPDTRPDEVFQVQLSFVPPSVAFSGVASSTQAISVVAS
jgi:hypothetical protein